MPSQRQHPVDLLFIHLQLQEHENMQHIDIRIKQLLHPNEKQHDWPLHCQQSRIYLARFGS